MIALLEPLGPVSAATSCFSYTATTDLQLHACRPTTAFFISCFFHGCTSPPPPNEESIGVDAVAVEKDHVVGVELLVLDISAPSLG